jgi:Heterokaryon incompatibility protein (HET)
MELHSFQEDNAPPYAILSHTWHDDEVLFQDLQDIPLASKKAGFVKIQFCCNQALEDGFEFVWVDTCCIDKTSSAELSEAINSMYRWYRGAHICYAYLKDVSQSEDHEEFVQSRWFKRVWTLQELLAPRRLFFYSTEWNKIGSSRDLKALLCQATGIDTEYFTGRDLYMASVAKRMSWAATREATRPEDIAYSLFGIFDVNMPLLYGEGQQKAFLRLQEEIMKSSDDHTLFAWNTAPNYETVGHF